MAVDDVVEGRVLICQCCSVAVFAFAGHTRLLVIVAVVVVVAEVVIVVVVGIADYLRTGDFVAPILVLRYIVVVDCKIKRGMRLPQCIYQGISAICLFLARV